MATKSAAGTLAANAKASKKSKVKAKPKVVVHVITRTRTRTHTIIKKVNVTPAVPAGAFLPSKRQPLTLASFIIAGGNIGCIVSSSDVRCAIVHKTWSGPRQPSNCVTAWGNSINLLSRGYAAFECGGMSAPPSNAKVVKPGYDDKVGQETCQVRTFGVDCFSADRRGFFMSRTGYTIY